jgi:hypothetical protein
MVYDRGEILTAPGHGRFVARATALESEGAAA